jgi:hypothetical protein
MSTSDCTFASMLAVGGCELNQLAQLALEKKKEEAETSVSFFF